MGSDKETDGNDEVENTKKIPYPKSIIFIVSQEFCERFSYYGMRTVLSLYLVQHLLFAESTATIIFHIFASFCYFTPIFGAFIADSFLGKFKTIFYLSVVYAAGSIILSLASAEQIGIHPTTFSMIGLALIAVGTGGIKPCVSAFGGDQFVLPQQSVQLASFFSVFYFAINAGSLISSTLTPIFRKDVNCSSKETCYPLAFSVPAALMVTSLIIFLFGKPFYKIKPPEGNIVMKVIRCIGHAISQKQKTNTGRRSHWLDFADDKFENRLIEDIKCLLNVLFLYIPLPIFWALYDQQGSTWTFQANRMDGYTLGYRIKPDQFQVINAFLILAFIPLFDKLIYPFLTKHNILKRPLQKLTTGGMLAGLAFVASGLLELKLQTTYPVLPLPGEVNLNFVNTLPCNVNLALDNNLTQVIIPNQNYIFEMIKAKKYNPEVRIIPSEDFACRSFSESFNTTNLVKTFEANHEGQKAFTILIVVGKARVLELVQPKLDDDLSKAEGDSKIKIVYYGLDDTWEDVTVSLEAADTKPYVLSIMSNNSDKMSSEGKIIHSLPYDVILRYTSTEAPFREYYEKLGKIEVESGGNYILSITKNQTNMSGSAGHNQPFALGLHTITRPNSIHILWLLPQYVIITVAEIMFSITGLEFSYSQAPESMKSVVSAAWLLTTAFGNLVVVGIAKAHFFDKQSKELFLYAAIMFVDMLIFSWMAYCYKPRKMVDKLSTEMNGNEDVRTYNKNQDNDGFDDEAL